MSEIPKCPDYIAHPQSVWFEEHWRPLIEKEREINRELSELVDGHNEECEMHSETNRLLADVLYKASEQRDHALAINKVLTEALKLQVKNRYGAQGYLEENDIEGYADYWAKDGIYMQDIAREALAKAEEMRG